jgi:hypothetical protein
LENRSNTVPVRKPNNWGGNIIGSFPSLKLGQSVPYQSPIERDLLFFLEYDCTVLRYVMQPMTITMTDTDGTHHRYTPDVQVVRTSGKALIECKLADLVDTPDTKRQIAIGQAWANANDHEFVVVSDVDLRTGYHLANLKILWRYARFRVPYAITERSLAVLAASPEGLSFHDTLNWLTGTAPHDLLPPCIYSLLFQQILDTDLSLPLEPASLLRLPAKAH